MNSNTCHVYKPKSYNTTIPLFILKHTVMNSNTCHLYKPKSLTCFITTCVYMCIEWCYGYDYLVFLKSL